MEEKKIHLITEDGRELKITEFSYSLLTKKYKDKLQRVDKFTEKEIPAETKKFMASAKPISKAIKDQEIVKIPELKDQEIIDIPEPENIGQGSQDEMDEMRRVLEDAGVKVGWNIKYETLKKRYNDYKKSQNG